MTCLHDTYGNGGQATPQIGNHAFLIITAVRYGFVKYKKGTNYRKLGDDEIPCLSSSVERDLVGANWRYNHRREVLLNNIIEKKRH